MKKILSLVLALMMVLSMTTAAFAGTYTDVKADNVVLTKAVEILSGFKVIDGFTDGTFRPEDNVTRAQMAKMLVLALGHGNIVEGSKSVFSDAQGTWYDSYVAIANELKIVTGYPNGTFGGDQKVTYTQAATMIMRALSYTNKAVNNDGSDNYHEASYKAAAARIGILSNVPNFKNGPANRGDIAIMIYNALSANIVTVDEKGMVEPKKLPNGTNMILLNALGTYSYAEITPELILANKGLDLEQYFGETIQVIRGENNEILYVVGRTQKVKEEVVTSIGARLNPSNIGASYGNRLYVAFNTVAGNYYEVNEGVNSSDNINASSNLKFYLNRVELSSYKVSAIYDHAVYINSLQDPTDPTPGSRRFGVPGNYVDVPTRKTLDNKTTKVKIVYNLDKNGKEEVAAYVFEAVNKVVLADGSYKDGNTRYQGLDLPLKDGKVDFDKITVTGAATDLADITKNDVIEAYVGRTRLNTIDNVRLEVTRNTETGKVTRADYSGNRHKTFKVNGTAYEFNPISGVYEKLNALLGNAKEGAHFLDQKGRIAFTSFDIDPSEYALVLDVAEGTLGRTVDTNYYVKTYPKALILTKEGKKVWKNIDLKVNSSTGAILKDSNGDDVVAGGFTAQTTNLVAVGDVSSNDVYGKIKARVSTTLTHLADSNIGANTRYISGEQSTTTLVWENDTHKDYLVVADFDDDFIYDISDVSKYPVLNGKKANVNFLANDKTVIFEKLEGMNNYRVIKYSALTSAVVDYQYELGWNVVVVRAIDRKVVTNAVYGVITQNAHETATSHYLDGFYVREDGAKVEFGTEITARNALTVKEWDGTGYVTSGAAIDTHSNAAGFQARFMNKFVRLEKNAAGKITSIAEAKGISVKTTYGALVTRDNRDFIGATGNINTQLSPNLIVFVGAAASATGQIESYQSIEAFEQSGLYGNLINNQEMQVTVYQGVSSYGDLIDVVFITRFY